MRKTILIISSLLLCACHAELNQTKQALSDAFGVPVDVHVSDLDDCNAVQLNSILNEVSSLDPVERESLKAKFSARYHSIRLLPTQVIQTTRHEHSEAVLYGWTTRCQGCQPDPVTLAARFAVRTDDPENRAPVAVLEQGDSLIYHAEAVLERNKRIRYLTENADTFNQLRTLDEAASSFRFRREIEKNESLSCPVKLLTLANLF